MQVGNSDDDYLGIEIPIVPPFRFGPETWNWIYYAILGTSLLIGLLALLSSGSVVDALLFSFISLMGTAFLSIAFLSFVIMPLCVSHHRRMVEARRAAVLASKAAAIEKLEREKAERYRTTVAQFQDEVLSAGLFDNESSSKDRHKPATDSSRDSKPTAEDQASSLRRMVAEAPTPSL
jgi:hypothetical protein